MTPEQKVPTRETCQALVDAGVRFKTERTWLGREKTWRDSALSYQSSEWRTEHTPDVVWLPAPDLAELYAGLITTPRGQVRAGFFGPSAQWVADRVLDCIASGSLTPAAVNAAIERKRP